jgi:hypothetical protein
MHGCDLSFILFLLTSTVITVNKGHISIYMYESMLTKRLNMNRSNVHFLDLPNEMLFYILKKLENVDVLYSLFGINHDRLDSITREEIFSTTLNFASKVDDTIILGRFCNYILPRIHSNVKCLIVEPASMERILLASPYPNLTELKIYNFQRDNSLNYFTGN